MYITKYNLYKSSSGIFQDHDEEESYCTNDVTFWKKFLENPDGMVNVKVPLKYKSGKGRKNDNEICVDEEKGDQNTKNRMATEEKEEKSKDSKKMKFNFSSFFKRNKDESEAKGEIEVDEMERKDEKCGEHDEIMEEKKKSKFKIPKFKKQKGQRKTTASDTVERENVKVIEEGHPVAEGNEQGDDAAGADVKILDITEEKKSSAASNEEQSGLVDGDEVSSTITKNEEEQMKSMDDDALKSGQSDENADPTSSEAVDDVSMGTKWKNENVIPGDDNNENVKEVRMDNNEKSEEKSSTTAVNEDQANSADGTEDASVKNEDVLLDNQNSKTEENDTGGNAEINEEKSSPAEACAEELNLKEKNENIKPDGDQNKMPRADDKQAENTESYLTDHINTGEITSATGKEISENEGNKKSEKEETKVGSKDVKKSKLSFP